MFGKTFLVVFIAMVKLGVVHVSCPVQNRYCLNRDPNDSCQVRAVDYSNRSMSWAWDSGPGRWDVAYSSNCILSGSCCVQTCYTTYIQRKPSCFSYSTAGGWKGDGTPIPATGWNMVYNGDEFGFQPGPNGQYVFHVYSRNLQYNPWMTGASNLKEDGTDTKEDMTNCLETGEERTKGNGWWLERKSRKQCPVVVNSGDLVSPMEWSWKSPAGKWKVVYAWGRGVNCTVDYTPTRARTVSLISWTFNSDRLLLDYTASPTPIHQEPLWKLMVSGGETWGFLPGRDATWKFSVFSRNVIIKPFEKPKGTFNLHNA